MKNTLSFHVTAQASTSGNGGSDSDGGSSNDKSNWISGFEMNTNKKATGQYTTQKVPSLLPPFYKYETNPILQDYKECQAITEKATACDKNQEGWV